MEKYNKYLIEFEANNPMADTALYTKQIEERFGKKLPADYIEFMEVYNGGEGSVGKSYVALYPISKIIELNRDYEIEEAVPGLMLIGSNGGGEAFAIDYRTDEIRFVMIPFLFEEDAIIELSDSFEGFLEKAYNGELFTPMVSCHMPSSINSAVGSMGFNSHQIQESIEKILGKADEVVMHSSVPFDLGYDIGGGADIYLYKNHVDGIVYVTGDLIGQEQEPSDAGNYELMICHRNEEEWGPNLISELAYCTLDTSINSGETMGIGAYALPENTIKAIIFDAYAGFYIESKKYGLMLAIGITEDELEWAKRHGGSELVRKLKERGIVPMTDLKRKSIFE